MKRPAEYAPAEPLPVRFGVSEVQVPGLVHLLRGSDRMARRDGEQRKALVFLDHALRVAAGPAIFASEPRREWIRGSRLVEGEFVQPDAKRSGVSGHDVPPTRPTTSLAGRDRETRALRTIALK